MTVFLVITTFVVSILFLAVVVAPWSYQLGASITGVEKPSFKDALILSILVGVVTSLVAGVLGLIPLLGGVLSFLAMFIVPAVMIQIGLQTTFVRGLIIEIFSIVVCSFVSGVVLLGLWLLGATAGVFQSALAAVGLG